MTFVPPKHNPGNAKFMHRLNPSLLPTVSSTDCEMLSPQLSKTVWEASPALVLWRPSLWVCPEQRSASGPPC